MRIPRFATGILEFSRRKGGAETYLANLCARMAKGDFEVHVYAERWDEKIEGVHFHRVKTIPFPKSLRLLSFAIRATREMEKENYDVTLGVGNTLKADVLQPHGGVHWAWFWRSLRAYDHPLLWLIKFVGRVLSPKQWVQGYIDGAPYRRNYKKIIAISDMVKEDLMGWYCIPVDRIVVIYNGVDTERFHPGNRHYREEIRRRHGIGDEFLILFVSNNFRMKGLKYLIKALAEIKKSDSTPCKCLILGRDKKAPYVRLSKKLGVSDDVIFAGSTEEPEKYYGAADLLVHPTFYDACSLTVLEALASGLPVITTYSNGASGILGDADAKFVINSPKDIELLKKKVCSFVDGHSGKALYFETRASTTCSTVELNYHAVKSVFLELAMAEGA